MPDIVLDCGNNEYVCTSITVLMYRKYTEIMERNTGDSALLAFRLNDRIIKTVLRVTDKDMRSASVVDRLAAAKCIHFTMQNIVNEKFLSLNPEHPEQQPQEASAFDAYDEENGYNDDDNSAENVWRIMRGNVDRVVKICIDGLKNSHAQCMESDIIELLDYVAFEMTTTANERK